MKEDVYTCDICGSKSSDVNNTREYRGVEIGVNREVAEDSGPVAVALCPIKFNDIPMPVQAKHLCSPCIESICRIREGLR